MVQYRKEEGVGWGGGEHGDRKGGIQEIKRSDGMGEGGRERERGSQDRAQGQREDRAVL